MPKPKLIPGYGDGTGEHAAMVKCPECGTIGWIPEDVLRGETSMICPNDDCDYHETHDLIGGDEPPDYHYANV